ncbi:P-loop containing nucleoside triphosphate hydrolase protein [Meira miltonrushii]|uniref:ATP-dependent RNA helicase n=1 Tax=Meira miltonrushii TaxID=1280837 RepID=A0A316V9U8_9BASI|nr:P-loop containing nucleoside triphosphate hydrolase protein [Meira miltonrushii]PWN32275.1 P-loop containing nucleoside triphosphate hydrolase protein [Meira miltonrushii]
MEAAKHFHNLGINTDLCKQLVASYDHIHRPTLSQALYLKAVRKQTDIILRASTATGKSFAALLSALNKDPTLFDKVREGMQDGIKGNKLQNIQTIIVVPTRELALQYGNWAKSLVPESLHQKLSTIVNVKYYTKQITASEHLKELRKETPRILVIKAKLFWQLLQEKDADRFLIRNLKTLILDEVDEMLELPGKFPNQKVIWKHSKHPPPALEAMKMIMTLRKTHSSGELMPMSGLENEKQLNRLPEDVRDRNLTFVKTLERNKKASSETSSDEANQQGGSNLPRFSTSPLQLVVMSATANAVLRHFLGARTGWLRTGIRDPVTNVELGKWIDTTGLSSGVKKADEMEGIRILPVGTSFPVQVPKEINHFSVVVDDVPDTPEGEGDNSATGPSIGWRNLKNLKSNESNEVIRNATKTTTDKPELNTAMLTCLAFIYATQGVRKGMLVIPDNLSIFSVMTFLREVGVPVQAFHEYQASQSNADAEEEFLLVTSKATIRGLDVPGGLSHIFILGVDAIGDASTYTHIAGRVSRLGSHVGTQEEVHQRPAGSVITLLHGLSKQDVKMSSIYKQLSLPLQKIQPLKTKVEPSSDD